MKITPIQVTIVHSGRYPAFFILILLTLIMIVLIYHLYTIYQKAPLLKLLIISV